MALAHDDDRSALLTPTLLRRSGVGDGLVGGAGGGAPAAGAAATPVRLPPRYQALGTLGCGGMGEVALARDDSLGREIAVKRLRPEAVGVPEAREEFLLELLRQARLEHPAIVPVYDVGVDESGQVFFTMKRVRGESLHEILARLAAHDAETRRRFPLHRLLDALGRAALAVDYAHGRGIVHRDLKPANLMLGDFGQVYVLDWGLSLDLAEERARRAVTPARPRPASSAAPDAAPALWTSLQAGTPGYAPPEQVVGDLASIGPRSDVWALGAILFRILTGEPYLRSESTEDLLLETLEPGDPHPAHRTPERDIPPELDELCARALAPLPGDRPATMAAFHEVLDRFLSGERDLALRGRLARQHVACAERAADRALTRADPGALDERALAMREVGSALALEPDNRAAMRVLVRLLGEPPRHMPADVEAELTRVQDGMVRRGFQLGALCYAGWLFALPFLLPLGVREPRVLVAFVVCTVATALYAWAGSRLPVRGLTVQLGMLVTTCVTLAIVSRAFGPLVVTPTALAVNLFCFAGSEHRIRRVLFVGLGIGITLALPMVLEALGVLTPSYGFADGTLIIRPNAVAFPPRLTLIILFIGNAAIIVGAAMWAGFSRDELDRKDRALLVHRWQLTQLLPDEPFTADAGRSTDVARRSPAPEDDMLSLIVREGPNPGTTYRMGTRMLTIGRDFRNPVQVVDPEVSRRHALVRWTGQQYVVTDLKSRNGIYVNGARTTENALGAGDELRVGRTCFSVVPDDRQAEDAVLGKKLVAKTAVQAATLAAQHAPVDAAADVVDVDLAEKQRAMRLVKLVATLKQGHQAGASPASVLAQAMNGVHALLGPDRVLVLRVLTGTHRCEVLAHQLGAEAPASQEHAPWDETATGRVLAAGRSAVENEPTGGALGSVAIAPIVRAGRVIGLLYADTAAESPLAFVPEDLRLLDAIGGALAPVLVAATT